MGYVKSDSRLSKHDEFSFIYICLGISVGLRFFSFFKELLPYYAIYSISILSCGLACFSLLLFLLKTMNNLSENKAFYIWILLSLYMLLIGAIRTNFFTASALTDNGYFIFQDVTYIILFAAGASFSNINGVKYYHKLMLFLGVASVICGIFSLFKYDFNMSRIAVRGDSLWTISYYLWWPSISFSTYLFAYARITGKNKIVAFVLFALAMLLSLLFQKRGTLLEGVFVYFLLAFIRPVRFKNRLTRVLSRILTVVLTVLVAIVVLNIVSKIPYLSRVTDSLTSRLKQIDKDNDSRMEESTIYFSEAPLDEILLGQGIGCYFPSSLRIINAIHIGIVNAIYKGGIFYILFYLWIIIASVRMLIKYKKLSSFGLTCLVTTLAYLVTSTHDGGWSYTMTVFGYATSVCYVLQYREDRDKFLIEEENLILDA